MSSLKMTFSLTSLIFLIALGLVIAPTSVMAHPASDTAVGPHTHPVTEAVEADTNATPPVLPVPIHGEHPIPMITLKANEGKVKGDEVIIDADDNEAANGVENQFTVVISFVDAEGMAMPVDDDFTATAADPNFSIALTNFHVLLLDKMMNPVAGNATIAAAARVNAAGGALTATDPIEAVVTIPAGSEPTGTDDMSELTIRLQLMEGSFDTSATVVYGLQKPVVVGAESIDVRGGHNVESEIAEFKLVQSLTADPPAAPASISAMAGDGEVTLTWASVTGATSYEYSMDGGTNWEPITNPTDNGDETMSVTVTATNDTAVSFIVRGVGPGGNGAASAASDSVTPMAVPGAVALMATAGDGQVMLSWTAPTTGGTVVSYEYSDNSVDYDPIPNSNAATTSHTVTGLTNGQTYTFTVRGVNSAGNGGASNAIVSTPKAPEPPAAPASISATAGDGQVTVTWTAATGADSYQYSMDGGTNWEDITNATDNGDGTMSITVTAANDTAVSFMVRGVGAGGNGAASAASDSVTPTAPVEVVKPVAPASISVVAGDGQVTVTWAAVDGATSYQYSKDGGTFWADIDDTAITDDPAAGTKSITVTGLTNGTEVSFMVRGVNSAGSGAASTAAAGTPMAPPTTPGAVTNLTATAGDRQVMLSWTAPATGDVASYEYSNNGVDYMPIANSDANTTSHTVTGLTNGQTYTFTVRAVGAGGSGDEGGASNAIVSTPVMTPPPAAPASITATAGNGKITVTWAAVTGATSYQYSTNGGTTWTAIANTTPNADGTMLSTDIAGPNGTEISVMVRALGPGGSGASSAAAAATPMAPAITPVSATVTVTVPAKSYVIVGRTASPDGLPSPFPANTAGSATTVAAWSTMPNLEDLFVQGGSLLLVTSDAKINRTNDADAANDAVAAKRDVLITEIMAARNTAKVGQAGYLTHQWIELYNNLPIDVSVTLSQKSGTPPPAKGTGEVELDLVSNVVTNARWEFTGLGADGSIGSGDATKDMSFVSFYRDNRGGDGHAKGHWKTSEQIYLTGADGTHVGTPGAAERKVSKPVDPTPVPYKDVIINEVGNLSGTDHDWIEIRNLKTDGGVNIKNWRISAISAKGSEKLLVKFPDDDHYTIPAGKTILVLATDPYDDVDHPILAGTKWNKGQARLGTPAATSTYYVASGGDDTFDNDGLGNGDYNLVLRNGYDGAKPDEKIIDITGAKKIPDVAFDTQVWPLKGANAPHGDVFHDALAEKFEGNKVYHRNNTGAGRAEHNWTAAGFTGLGYKRSHEKGSAGSPGYLPDTKEKSSDLTDASVSISEIMYETNATKTRPQWIELYNNSATQTVNLNEWKLKFENAGDADIRDPITTNNLPGKLLLPKQTVLIVSRKSASVSRVSVGDDDFPDTRVINLYDQKGRLEVDTPNYKLLSTEAFRVTLIQKGGGEVDVVGNMDDNGMAMWALPESDKGEGRSSIIRLYDADDMPLGGTDPAWFGKGSIRNQGKEGLTGGPGSAGWVFAADASTDRGLYYGSRTDRGTPGFRATGPLPVSLSSFRPVRLKDTGEIVVRWVTESELNNAGFNILRSDKKDGEFTKVHFRAGQGTTSERTVYEWTDKSAKPNVVYYYQIQDVSLDGEVTTLRVTHLRGNVTAAGKLTTTWGEIKALQ